MRLADIRKWIAHNWWVIGISVLALVLNARFFYLDYRWPMRWVVLGIIVAVAVLFAIAVKGNVADGLAIGFWLLVLVLNARFFYVNLHWPLRWVALGTITVAVLSVLALVLGARRRKRAR